MNSEYEELARDAFAAVTGPGTRGSAERFSRGAIRARNPAADACIGSNRPPGFGLSALDRLTTEFICGSIAARRAFSPFCRRVFFNPQIAGDRLELDAADCVTQFP